MHRCTTYDAGGLLIQNELRAAGDLTPQQLAEQIGTEGLEVTHPPFPHRVVVWPEGLDIEPEMWLREEPNIELAAGRWKRSPR